MPENTLQGEHRQLHLRRDADDRERAEAAALRAAILAITSSIIALAGVIAPLAMGAVIRNASSPLAGNEQSYVILGGLLLAGGIIGLLFIRPETDRARLAAHTIVLRLGVSAAHRALVAAAISF